MKNFLYSRKVLLIFVIRRNIVFAAIWGIAFGIIVATNAIGIIKAYSNLKDFYKIVASFSNNTGLTAIYGHAQMLNTVVGFTVWKSLGVIWIIAAIWAIMISTKVLRGEEEAGRLELMLSGQTSLKEATVNSLLGLYTCLSIMLLLSFFIVAVVCNTNSLHFDIGGCMLLSFSMIASAIEFISVGAFFSQLFSTKRQALIFTVATYGICYLLKVIADTSTDLNWLLNIDPLGWIENMQPLTNNQIIWILPILIFSAFFTVLTIYLSGKRDMSGSIISTLDNSKSKMYFLSSTFGFIVRESLVSILIWFLSISFFSYAAGTLAKVGGQAFDDSIKLQKAYSRLDTSKVPSGASIYISVILLFAMLLVLLMVINFVGKLRDEEAQGYLDNLLVRKISRIKWIYCQMIVIIFSIFLVGIGVGIFSWLGSSAQGANIDLSKMIFAGINSIAPAVFIFGVGILIFAIKPRFTLIFLYMITAWSFLLNLIGPSLNISKYILNTSIFYHIALAPSVEPDWNSVSYLIIFGIIGCITGSFFFNRRDLEYE